MQDTSLHAQLEGFLAKYTPEIAAEAAAGLERLRAQVPGAVEMVYDNYNGLVIAFGATEKPSEAVLSVALMPRWVNLFFLAGATLPDPHALLQGSGKAVRHVVLRSASDIDRPGVRELIARAVASSVRPFDIAKPGRMVIKSISAKQRPRRPAEKPGAGKPRA